MNLTDTQFEDLWAAIHRTRKNGKTVTVKKRDLENLLMDYAKLYDKVVSGTGGSRWER